MADTLPLFDAHLEARARGFRRSAAVLVGLTLLALASAWLTDLLQFGRFADGSATLAGMIVKAMPPDFAEWRTWVRPLLDTLAMSVGATVVCVVLSLPLAICASPTTAPNRACDHAARAIFNCLRSIPELIMGIFLVGAYGFGALPGVLALALHSTGMVAKFYAEAIEHVDRQPIEAAQACGATPFQVVTHGVLPQVFPQLVDITLYRWEYHFHASTVVGIVGAGGIGFQLIGALRLVKYDAAVAILLIIFVMVMAIDGLSAALRRRFK